MSKIWTPYALNEVSCISNEMSYLNRIWFSFKAKEIEREYEITEICLQRLKIKLTNVI